MSGGTSKSEKPGERRWTDGGVYIIGEQVIHDGEAAGEGDKPLMWVPLPEDEEGEDDKPAR